ncbi:MAG: type II toxin-antitoxin system RelE/ParE family toxin [Chitinophagales bacterium]
MAKFHLSKKAVDDLTEIWEYTYDEWSEKQADNYYHFLLKICQELAENPTSGKRYTEIGIDILGYLANKHIIFYQITSKNEITIIRILHGSMDLKSRMED